MICRRRAGCRKINDDFLDDLPPAGRLAHGADAADRGDGDERGGDGGDSPPAAAGALACAAIFAFLFAFSFGWGPVVWVVRAHIATLVC